MKVFVCEMCGSNDLLKQDGFYVCQNCGAKYSPDEAKKLMVEGTVKVDNSEFVAKYLTNARRAKQKEDWEETEKYYNMVEQNDPSNIEAIFYSAYGKAVASLSVNDIYRREDIFKALKNSVGILDDNYDPEKSKEIKPVLEQIVADTIRLFSRKFVYTEYKNGYGVVTSEDSAKTYQLFIDVAVELNTTLEQILKKTTLKADKLFLYKQQLRLSEFMAFDDSHLIMDGKINWCDRAQLVSGRIRGIDPTHVSRDYIAAREELMKSASRKKAGGVAKGVLIGVFIFIAVIIYLLYMYGYEIGYWLGYNGYI